MEARAGCLDGGACEVLDALGVAVAVAGADVEDVRVRAGLLGGAAAGLDGGCRVEGCADLDHEARDVLAGDEEGGGVGGDEDTAALRDGLGEANVGVDDDPEVCGHGEPRSVRVAGVALVPESAGGGARVPPA